MFMDFENIARGVKEAQYKQFELKLVLERLADQYEAKAAAYELARLAAGYARDPVADRSSAA